MNGLRSLTTNREGKAMTAQDGRTWVEDIKNLMATWDKCRAAWIEKFGNDIGFDKWFSTKLERGKG